MKSRKIFTTISSFLCRLFFIIWISCIVFFFYLCWAMTPLSETNKPLFLQRLQKYTSITLVSGVVAFIFLIFAFIIFRRSIKTKNKKFLLWKKKHLTLKRGLLGIIVSLFLVILLFASLLITKVINLDKTYPNELPFSNAIFEKSSLTKDSVEQAINKYRAERGLNPLITYEPLCDLAKVRVYEIKTDWSHFGFEKRSGENSGDGTLYKRFCDTDKLKCTFIGENLARDFTSTSSVLNAWKVSKGHNDNLLGDYNSQCVAIDGLYIASLFAKTNLVQITNSNLGNGNNLVSYNYEKVTFWEKRLAEDRGMEDSWSSARGKDIYTQSDVSELLSCIDRKIEIGLILWNGFTNSKITYNTANTLDTEYWGLNEKTAKLSKDLNEEGKENNYKNCIKIWEDMEDKYGIDYSNEIKGCKKYLE